MSQKICLKSLDGFSIEYEKSLLSEKSSYFKSLFEGPWQGSDANEIDIDVSFRRMHRIFDFALGETRRLKEKDRAIFSYFFPGVFPHKPKEHLELNKEVCKTLFLKSFVFESGKEECAGKANFTFQGGHIVVKPHETDISIEACVKSLTVTAKKKWYDFERARCYSVDGFWLWCYIVLGKHERFIERMYEETGLIVLPVHPFFRMVFLHEGNLNLHSKLLFECNRKALFVCDGTASGMSWNSEFCPYDNTKEKDELWEHTLKTSMLKNRTSIEKGFLLGLNIPAEAKPSKIKYFTSKYFLRRRESL